MNLGFGTQEFSKIDFHQRKFSSLLLKAIEVALYVVFCTESSKGPLESLNEHVMCQNPSLVIDLIVLSASGSWSYKLTKLQISSIETIPIAVLVPMSNRHLLVQM